MIIFKKYMSRWGYKPTNITWGHHPVGKLVRKWGIKWWKPAETLGVLSKHLQASKMTIYLKRDVSGDSLDTKGD